MYIVEEWNDREKLFWKEQLNWTEWFTHTLVKRQQILWHYDTQKYRKIPKISPGAYIFQRPFSRGLFLEGLILRGAYLMREICVSKSIGLAL